MYNMPNIDVSIDINVIGFIYKIKIKSYQHKGNTFNFRLTPIKHLLNSAVEIIFVKF